MNTILNKFGLLIKLLILAGFIACTKIELWPNPEEDTASPGPFTLTISDVTDKQATLQWSNSTDSDGDSVKYEIAINDSVIAFNLETTFYRVSSLTPDRQYIVSVMALDKSRNQYQVIDEFKTMKSYYRSIIPLNLNVSWIIFLKAVKTADNGVLIGGNFVESSSMGGSRSFVMKLDQNSSLKWFHSLSSINELNDLVECSDAGCLAVYQKSVFRLNGTGDELWNYTNSDSGSQSEIKCATEDVNGNFVLAGISDKTWGTDISLQYSLFSLSPSGSELWYHYGGTSLISRPRDISLLSDGTILVFGSADYLGTTFASLLSAKECFWTMRADESGNFLNQTFYPNAFSDTDVPFSIVSDNDHNFLLSGTSSGLISPDDFYFGMQPRFIKIASDGTFLWDKYPYLESNVENSFTVSDIFPIEGNRFFVLAQANVSILNSAGEIEQSTNIDVFPAPLFVSIYSQGCYRCIIDGSIAIINPDGYHK